MSFVSFPSALYSDSRHPYPLTACSLLPSHLPSLVSSYSLSHCLCLAVSLSLWHYLSLLVPYTFFPLPHLSLFPIHPFPIIPFVLLGFISSYLTISLNPSPAIPPLCILPSHSFRLSYPAHCRHSYSVAPCLSLLVYSSYHAPPSLSLSSPVLPPFVPYPLSILASALPSRPFPSSPLLPAPLCSAPLRSPPFPSSPVFPVIPPPRLSSARSPPWATHMR